VWLLVLLAGACGWRRGQDVIFLPSASDVVARMLDLGRVKEKDVLYDLGCGDGRIVIAAAKVRNARGVCVDIDPALIETSQRNADTAGVRARIEFRRADLFETDLSTATVVALYLSPSLNQRLRPKLLREVRPGARIVSHNFDMGDWRPDTLVRVAWPSGTTSTVYAWVLPADVAGTWVLTASTAVGERRFRLRFSQHYQELSGTASLEGRPVELSGARLVGDSLEFDLAARDPDAPTVLRLVGRVSGGIMTGLVWADSTGAGSAWRATRP
jgi:SAM-dependent methyltransferase